MVTFHTIRASCGRRFAGPAYSAAASGRGHSRGVGGTHSSRSGFDWVVRSPASDPPQTGPGLGRGTGDAARIRVYSSTGAATSGRLRTTSEATGRRVQRSPGPPTPAGCDFGPAEGVMLVHRSDPPGGRAPPSPTGLPPGTVVE